MKKPASKYTSFKNLSYEEKENKIYKSVFEVTNKDWLANKILEKVVEITPSRKWKDSVGCPIVKIDGKVFREINSRFPLQKIVGILSQKFIHESLENESL